MGKLDTTVGEAERLYREMRALAESGDAEGKNRIVKLRSRYAMLMLEILQTMKGDERLQGDPELKAEFETRFFAMRSALAEHQAKWRLQAIEERGTSVNVGSFVGAGTLRQYGMGMAMGDADSAALETMRSALADAMRDVTWTGWRGARSGRVMWRSLGIGPFAGRPAPARAPPQLIVAIRARRPDVPG